MFIDNKIIFVFVIALVFTIISKIVCYFFEPEKEIEELHKKIARISELSNDALECGNKEMYYVLQKQGNELLHQLFLKIFFSAIYELTPHIVALGILQKTLPLEDFVNLPFSFWIFGDSIGWQGWYIFSAFFWYAIFRVTKMKVKFK